MPEADVTADFDSARFEVAKVNGVWTRLRRMARRRGDQAWSPDSPDHASTGVQLGEQHQRTAPERSLT
jgi:hypothetical protein